MITEHTLVTDEQVGTIARPLAHTVLMKHYGPDFCRASTEECLILLETIAFCLRVGASFSDGLRTIVGDGPEMPCDIYTPAGVGRNEGLKLLAILQVGLVERYSVAALNRQRKI